VREAKALRDITRSWRVFWSLEHILLHIDI